MQRLGGITRRVSMLRGGHRVAPRMLTACLPSSSTRSLPMDGNNDTSSFITSESVLFGVVVRLHGRVSRLHSVVRNASVPARSDGCLIRPGLPPPNNAVPAVANCPAPVGRVRVRTRPRPRRKPGALRSVDRSLVHGALRGRGNGQGLTTRRLNVSREALCEGVGSCGLG